tara:strand:+ start:71 stop:640 length:570 start_codon:yes stop_codon:yes gene_type:complete
MPEPGQQDIGYDAQATEAEAQDWHPRFRSPSSESYTSLAGTHPAIMGDSPQGIIGGSGYQQEDRGVQDAPPVVSVDTFEDVQKASDRSPVYRGYPGNKQGKPGSVNLAPMGINVGYRGKKSGAITSFDELDESTKAAVEGARIQSQSEDETENAIAQIFGAFQSIMGKAQKNTTNRVEGREGNAEQGDG